MAVEDVFMPPAKKLIDVTGKEIDEVEKAAEHIGVVAKTVTTADQLAGGPAMRDEIRRKEERIREMEKRQQDQQRELENTKLEVVRTELGSKIEALTSSLATGASSRTIAEQIADIKAAAGQLGLGESGTKWSEFREMAAVIKSLSPDNNIVQQIKDVRALMASLEGEKKPLAELPASIALQMKELETNTQLRIEEMRADREARAQEWQLTVRRWDEERDLRREEAAAKIALERERNQMIGGGIEKLGRVMARGMMESGGDEVSASPKIASQFIEAAVGEFGETTCPSCSGIIPIAKDAVKAICPGCSTIYPVRRVAAPSAGVEAEE
jgi:predicted RNA-binding Zn-ribbon protein involved in translation (DUF1610 family)